MKSGIHPDYHADAVIACACGAQYKVGSTSERIDIELCAACHPFFTGKQKIIDSARRVEKFTDRSVAKVGTVKTAKVKAKERAARSAVKAKKRADRDTTIKSAR